MSDYGRLGGQAVNQPSAPLPSGLNPRLELVRDGLASAIKAVSEIRSRLGIPDAPEDPKSASVVPGAAGLTMMLMVQSQRLGQMLAETLQEIGQNARR